MPGETSSSSRTSELDFVVHLDTDEATIELFGELNARLESLICAGLVVGGVRRLIVDLREVTDMDAGAVGAVARAGVLQHKSDTELVFRMDGGDNHARNTFRTTLLDTVVNVEELPS